MQESCVLLTMEKSGEKKNRKKCISEKLIDKLGNRGVGMFRLLTGYGEMQYIRAQHTEKPGRRMSKPGLPKKSGRGISKLILLKSQGEEYLRSAY